VRASFARKNHQHIARTEAFVKSATERESKAQ
jgi:hypothetical protein